MTAQPPPIEGIHPPPGSSSQHQSSACPHFPHEICKGLLDWKRTPVMIHRTWFTWVRKTSEHLPKQRRRRFFIPVYFFEIFIFHSTTILAGSHLAMFPNPLFELQRKDWGTWLGLILLLFGWQHPLSRYPCSSIVKHNHCWHNMAELSCFLTRSWVALSFLRFLHLSIVAHCVAFTLIV